MTTRPEPGRDVVDELRRVRDEARESVAAGAEKLPVPLLPEVDRLATPGLASGETTPAAPIPIPVTNAVNELWRTDRTRRGRLGRLLGWLWRGSFADQEGFNAAQVRFDNALVAFVEARLAATHAHYDALLGKIGRHLEEADVRHTLLQQELVRHVHDLVRRTDLVLSVAEKNRLAQEQMLRELREKLVDLERRAAGE